MKNAHKTVENAKELKRLQNYVHASKAKETM